jgi:nitronate monooxygenase
MGLPAILQGCLRIPVVGAPMFIISGPELVVAQCKAGIVGAFPALGARSTEILDAWLTQVTEELAIYDRQNPHAPSAPFAVNQIVHATNIRLDADLALCAKHKVPIVTTSLGARHRTARAGIFRRARSPRSLGTGHAFI